MNNLANDELTGFSGREIEQAAISVLMQWPEESFAMSDAHAITSEHFQNPSNRVLFDSLQNFFRKGKPIELISFTHELRALGILDAIGGPFYLTQTWLNTSHSANPFGYYLDLIEQEHARLRLSVTCREAITEAEIPAREGEELVTTTIGELSAIPLPSRHHSVPRTLADAVQDKFDRLESGQSGEDFVSTGLADLDRMSPLRKGDMPLIAGHRKSGKSILALSVALNIARAGTPVVYFSLEDREPKLMDRIFANVARRSMNAEGIHPGEVNKLHAAAAAISKLPLFIHDSVFDLPRILAVSRELKARKGIGLIVVDYGQLVVVPERNRDSNREQRVAEMSRSFRLLAMELEVPLILLSQLNDAGLTRESRALEQDSTAMWRVELVPENPKSKVPVFEKNLRSIAVPWQRNGESGIAFKVAFLGDQARVENAAAHDDDL